ncbi:MAG: YifB family Mg chelatase-like AAA ATPase [Nitriliruptorales bacterium]|nr:YifB family Mg chelatase-like AAA ATPase [Nitriliruptorales bacterium]
MVAFVRTAAVVGLEPWPVTLECWVGPGLPGTRLVGLPDAAVKEAADRAKAAVKSTGLSWPTQRIIGNLAPAEVPKAGAGFDLAFALGVLGASGALETEHLRDVWALGELGLDGSVRPVPGTLPIASLARSRNARLLLVADTAAVEASLIEGLAVVPVADLREAVAVLRGDEPARAAGRAPRATRPNVPDLADVRGQAVARRAIEIAAAGDHHVLLAGPPGCGKSMLARRLPGLLPELPVEQAMEVAAIHSVAGVRDPAAPLDHSPPYRAPHHTVSIAGLVGGGSGIARPGEISLAHAGILFLDELLEMPRRTLDVLREPLETGEVRITRARASVRFPARCRLVAATNPCPCGHLGDPRADCRCRPDRIDRYRERLSGPLLDRIDLQVTMHPVVATDLLGESSEESTDIVRARVVAARTRRDARRASGGRVATPAALERLARAIDALALSSRSFDACLRVARTIADLDGVGLVGPEHVDEAIAHRMPVNLVGAA